MVKGEKALKQEEEKRKQQEKKKKRIIFKSKKDKEKAEKKGKKDKKKDKQDWINGVAQEIADKFTYSQIVDSVDLKGGYELHGWLEIEHEDDFEELIDNLVLDRACYYAKKKHKPEVLKIVRYYRLDQYVKTGVLFKREVSLENYPNRPFKRAIFLAEKELLEAINWMKNKLEEIDGYEVPLNVGHTNLDLIGWVLWNRPCFLVTHTPTQNRAIYQAKIRAEAIKDNMSDILKKIVHKYRGIGKTIEDKMDEIKRREYFASKNYSDLKNQMGVEARGDLAKTPTQLGLINKPTEKPLISQELLIAIILIISILAIIGLFT